MIIVTIATMCHNAWLLKPCSFGNRTIASLSLGRQNKILARHVRTRPSPASFRLVVAAWLPCFYYPASSSFLVDLPSPPWPAVDWIKKNVSRALLCLQHFCVGSLGISASPLHQRCEAHAKGARPKAEPKDCQIEGAGLTLAGLVWNSHEWDVLASSSDKSGGDESCTDPAPLAVEPPC